MQDHKESETLQLAVLKDIACEMQENMERMRPYLEEASEIQKQIEETVAPIAAAINVVYETIQPLFDNLSMPEESWAAIIELFSAKPSISEEPIIMVTAPQSPRQPSAEEIAEIVAKKIIENTVKAQEIASEKPIGKLRFELSSGSIMQGEARMHKFQAKYPDESGIRRFGKTGHIFAELFFKRAVIEKENHAEKMAGQTQRIDMLMGMTGISTSEGMRNTMNSIQTIIDKKHLPLKISRGISEGVELLLLTEEI